MSPVYGFLLSPPAFREGSHGLPQPLLPRKRTSERQFASAIAATRSGALADGMRGSAAVRKCGGMTMVQNQISSEHFGMPCAAMDFGGSEISLSPRKIAEALCAVGT